MFRQILWSDGDSTSDVDMAPPPSELRLLISNADDLPDDLSIHSEGGCYYLRAPFAESTDGRWWTFVDVGLTPKTNETPVEGRRPIQFYEFGYQITLLDTYLQEPIRSTFDRYIARRWLPPDSARLALEVVGSCCRTLVEVLRPDYIYRVTFMANPSERALEKHHFVTEVLEYAGFSVLYTGTDARARRFWLMGAAGVDLPALL